MPDVIASRTLVKSPPELWTECSDAGSLGRHLDGFGDIRITRLEPETAVAWEGEHASGTVRLEPSGWGTRVVLTATPRTPELAGPRPDVVEDQPIPEDPPPRGLFRRLMATLRHRPAPEPELARGEQQPDAGDEPERAPQATSALDAALESLGKAHHRPFSRG